MLKTCLTQAVCLALVLSATAQDPAALPIQKTAPPSSVQLRPSKLDFGSLTVGTASPPQTATLTNGGSSPVAITDVFTSGIDFSQTNTCGQSLAAGAYCTVQITFKPITTGQRFGSLIVLNSDPASPHMLVLSGTGD